MLDQPVLYCAIFIAGPQRMWIPSTYIMCLESLSHLLVMIASSSNFIIYCTISTKFKIFLKRRIMFRFEPNPESASFNSRPDGLMMRSFRNSNVVATNGIQVIASPRHRGGIMCQPLMTTIPERGDGGQTAQQRPPCIIIETNKADMFKPSRNGKTSVSLYKRRSNSVFPDLLGLAVAKSKSVSNIETSEIMLLNEDSAGTKTDTPESASTVHTPNQRSFSLNENSSSPFHSQTFDTLSM